MNKRAREQAELLAELLPSLARRFNTLDIDDPIIELPIAQLRICRILENGPSTMSALSSELGISLSAVTQLADRLERSGFVERVSDSCDRRVKVLQLTESGKNALQNRKQRRVERIERLLHRLSEDECAHAIESLQFLLAAANRV